VLSQLLFSYSAGKEALWRRASCETCRLPERGLGLHKENDGKLQLKNRRRQGKL
jgi:hypothetical protein